MPCPWRRSATTTGPRSRPTSSANASALEAAHAIADADPWAVEYRPFRLGLGDADLAVPAPGRRRSARRSSLRTSRRIVSLPLLDLPTVADLERELAERTADLVARGEAGETRVTMNPIRYHISWLETTLAQEAAGGRATAVDGEIWAARIGDCAIVGAPGEIFGAIGTAVRAPVAGPGHDLRRLQPGEPRLRGHARTNTRTAATSRLSRIGATGNPPRSRRRWRASSSGRPLELLQELFA